jgi:hypothetical protein
MGTALFAQLSTAQLPSLTTAQIDALTTDQLRTLDSADLRALTTAQLAGFTTSTDIAAFTTSQIQAFTTEQLAALSTTQIQWLQTDDIVALTTDQVLGFGTSQIQAFTTAQIDVFETDDLKAMTATQVAAFTSTQLNAMDTSQIDALVAVSPIVLDLDGDGVSTFAASEGVNFDLLAIGQQARVGWVGGGDGLLAMDRNGDGVINDGSELFGVGTRLASGERAGHGYQALAELDSHRDGRIDARDERFADLRLWIDKNRDAKTDTGELLGLVDLGIVELNLDYALSDRMDNGNLVGMISDYTTADGQKREMADVWFAKDTSAGTPPLSELLADAAEPLPGAAEAPSAKPAPAVAQSPVVVGSSGVPGAPSAEDELRQQGPLV